MGGRSPLAMLCQGCQPLLLPFSSLFYKFSRFLQVGINPSQGRVAVLGHCSHQPPCPWSHGKEGQSHTLIWAPADELQNLPVHPRSLLQV